MMKKLDEKGSTIITGVVIVMIIFVILGTALGIAMNYQKRSINEHARKQAYLNAVSIVDAIAGQINKENSAFLPQNGKSERKIKEVNLPGFMTGDISAVIKYDTKDSNVLYIQVTSTYAEQTEELQLTLLKQSGKWKKVTYSEIGDEFNHETE